MNEHSDNFRMYGLVNYQLTGIQQAIQYGHALQEYNNMIFDDPSVNKSDKTNFMDWRLSNKTFIILNGGTTNNKKSSLGTLNKHAETLVKMGVITAEFYEPDLGDQLTAVVFLVPNNVYDKKIYPNFLDWIDRDTISRDDYLRISMMYKMGELSISSDQKLRKYYRDWVKFVGGKSNVAFREFLQDFRLA